MELIPYYPAHITSWDYSRVNLTLAISRSGSPIAPCYIARYSYNFRLKPKYTVDKLIKTKTNFGISPSLGWGYMRGNMVHHMCKQISVKVRGEKKKQ